jgi:hypothetical protein
MLSIMWRKSLKVTAWIVGVIVGVPVVVYVAAVLVNLHDQQPSPDALHLTAAYDTRPAVTDDDNAFIYLLGIDAPLEEDPRGLGARRLAWLQQASKNDSSAGNGDPQSDRLSYASTDPAVARFVTMCGSDTRDCAAAFADSRAVLEAWTTTHTWLLERYRALIAHTAWREQIFGPLLPLPNYAPAIHGQRLLLLQAKALADGGDVEGAASLLDSDARFWRMALESSDMLITKMIATAALRQHFTWGFLALRSVPPQLITAAQPAEWRRPMTATELSLRRTLAGEYVYFSGAVLNLLEADWADGDAMASLLLRPLIQEQDTLNRHAAYLSRLADTLEAPLESYSRLADEASDLAQRTSSDAFPPRSLYNVVGALALAAGPADYSSYARRVADIEGVRRAASVTLGLRAQQLETAEVARALAASPLRNPYDDQPLLWDETEQAVVFVGLEPGERGEHRFYY